MTVNKSVLIEQIQRDLEAFATRGVIKDVQEIDALAHIEAYERLWEQPIEELVVSFGERDVRKDIVCDVLETNDVALSHDTEFIYGYRGDDLSYEALIERYADLVGDPLSELSYEIDGDWSAQEEVRIVLCCGNVRAEDTAEYNRDWADTGMLIDLFNRLLSRLEDPRRLRYVPVGEGTDTHVFVLHTEHTEFVKQYFSEID